VTIRAPDGLPLTRRVDGTVEPAARPLLERALCSTFRQAGSSGVYPPSWLTYVPVVEDLHRHRAAFRALTVAVFDVDGDLWAVAVHGKAGDRRSWRWYTAHLVPM
jgi:hypothetical protein